MNLINPICPTCWPKQPKNCTESFIVSNEGQTAVERLALELKETPQELRSNMKSVAKRMASEMKPPGRVVNEQDFDRGVETSALRVLEILQSAYSDPKRPAEVVARIFYSQARDLVLPPMESTRITQEVIDDLKQKYAEAQRADKDDVTCH
jgi:hypothetical protein